MIIAVLEKILIDPKLCCTPASVTCCSMLHRTMHYACGVPSCSMPDASWLWWCCTMYVSAYIMMRIHRREVSARATPRDQLFIAHRFRCGLLQVGWHWNIGSCQPAWSVNYDTSSLPFLLKGEGRSVVVAMLLSPNDHFKAQGSEMAYLLWCAYMFCCGVIVCTRAMQLDTH